MNITVSYTAPFTTPALLPGEHLRLDLSATSAPGIRYFFPHTPALWLDPLEDRGRIVITSHRLMYMASPHFPPTQQDARSGGTPEAHSSLTAQTPDNGPVSNTVCIPWQLVSLHAVSRDLQSFPRACVYCQIDVKKARVKNDQFESNTSSYTNGLDHDTQHNQVQDQQNSLIQHQERQHQDNQSAPDDDDEQNHFMEDEEATSTEVRFVPERSEEIDEIFKAMCEAAAMNPDPEDDDYEGGEYNDEMFFDFASAVTAANLTEDFELSAEGLQNLERLNQLSIGAESAEDPYQFDDAEEEEEE